MLSDTRWGLGRPRRAGELNHRELFLSPTWIPQEGSEDREPSRRPSANWSETCAALERLKANSDRLDWEPDRHSAFFLSWAASRKHGFLHGLVRKAGANFIPASQNHLIYFTAWAGSDRLEQIFAVVPARLLFGEPDGAWRD
jgi:hypothetical protein